MVTREWKVYGARGHIQKESFNPSYRRDWSTSLQTRIVEVLNADRTGTNDYSIIKITRDTLKECKEELAGQISDGIFENCVVGNIIEVIPDKMHHMRYNGCDLEISIAFLETINFFNMMSFNESIMYALQINDDYPIDKAQQDRLEELCGAPGFDFIYKDDEGFYDYDLDLITLAFNEWYTDKEV